MKEKSSQNKKWLKKRHKVVIDIVYPFFALFCKLRYHVKPERFDKRYQNTKRNFLILSNHQTPMDQFLLSIAMKRAVYYVASDDIFSKGFISALLKRYLAPIPIKKQALDVGVIKNCMKVAKEGGNIAIFPEGNRTFSGHTMHMNTGVAALAKKLGLPIAFFRIEGGYGVNPRWADRIAHGKFTARVSRVMEPEEYAELSKEEFYEIIKNELAVDDVTDNDESYVSKKSAEYLERLIYVCPECGLSDFVSKNDTFTCKKCGKTGKYTDKLTFTGDFGMKNVTEWYNYQEKFINSLKIDDNNALYTDFAKISKVYAAENRREIIARNAECELYADKIILGGTELPFSEITAISVLGKNKINAYHGGFVYQIKGAEKTFNAVKYVNFYHRYKNITGGDENAEFLGF